jgi:hypothetical protein
MEQEAARLNEVDNKPAEGRQVFMGTILEDRRSKARWIVKRIVAQGCWVKDYPEPKFQSQIIFLWLNVNRLDIAGHVSQESGGDAA